MGPRAAAAGAAARPHLCLRTPQGQYSTSQAAAFEVQGWAVQPTVVSAGAAAGATLAVTGKDVSTPVTVAVVPAATACDGLGAAMDGLAVVLAGPSLPLAGWSLPGALRGGEWSP